MRSIVTLFLTASLFSCVLPQPQSLEKAVFAKQVQDVSQKYLHADDLDQAESGYRMGQELNARNHISYDGIGSVYFRKKNYALSKHWFRKAIAVCPQYARGHLHLGDASRALKQYEQAEKHYAHAARLDPFDPHILNNYAAFLLETTPPRAHDQTRRHRRARYMLERAKFVASGKKGGTLVAGNLKKLK